VKQGPKGRCLIEKPEEEKSRETLPFNHQQVNLVMLRVGMLRFIFFTTANDTQSYRLSESVIESKDRLSFKV
jgi:hypothetical protein